VAPPPIRPSERRRELSGPIPNQEAELDGSRADVHDELRM